MTANDIFKRLLKDPILKERYGLTEEVLNQTQLHSDISADVVEVMKFIVQGVEDGTPDRSIYSEIKNHFNV